MFVIQYMKNVPESRNICSSSVKVLKDAGFSTSCAIHLDEANDLRANKMMIAGCRLDIPRHAYDAQGLCR
jgi:hypothetical protein